MAHADDIGQLTGAQPGMFRMLLQMVNDLKEPGVRDLVIYASVNLHSSNPIVNLNRYCYRLSNRLAQLGADLCQ